MGEEGRENGSAWKSAVAALLLWIPESDIGGSGWICGSGCTGDSRSADDSGGGCSNEGGGTGDGGGGGAVRSIEIGSISGCPVENCVNGELMAGTGGSLPGSSGCSAGSDLNRCGPPEGNSLFATGVLMNGIDSVSGAFAGGGVGSINERGGLNPGTGGNGLLGGSENRGF